MSSKIVDAFRKRMLYRGYTSISIECIVKDKFFSERFYLVSAVEPLAKQKISFVCSESELSNILKEGKKK